MYHETGLLHCARSTLDTGAPKRSSPVPAGAGGDQIPMAKFVQPFAEVRPEPVLTTLTLLGVIYTASISGGYGLEDSVKSAGPLMTILFLVIIPLLWGVPVSLCVGELSCSIPSNAGPIMWVNVSFSAWFTFTVVIWTLLLNCVDNSLYPTLFADYYVAQFGLSPLFKAVFIVIFVWTCAAINIIGVHIVGAFSVGIMIVTIAPFALMFALQLPQGIDWQRVMYVPHTINWGLFLPVVCWNFSGFDSAGHVIEEVKNPKKTFVRALLLVILCGLATYVPPILVGSSAHKLSKVAFEDWGDGYWVDVGKAVGGDTLATVVLVGSTISTFGLMTTLITTTSRSMAGMGSINAFPTPMSRFLSKYHPRFGTPVNAIVLNSTIVTILAICLTFEILVAVDQVLYALRLVAILACYLKLHWTQPNLIRPYQVPGGTLGKYFCSIVPLIFSLILIYLSMSDTIYLFCASLTIIFGAMILGVMAVYVFGKSAFEGEIIDVIDAEFDTYDAILYDESDAWRGKHPDPEHPYLSKLAEDKNDYGSC